MQYIRCGGYAAFKLCYEMKGNGIQRSHLLLFQAESEHKRRDGSRN